MKSEDIKILGPVIIESLKKDEKKTGKILVEEILKYKRFEEPNLSAFYYPVQTKNEFIASLNMIIKRVQKDHLFPFLHIEAHGSVHGIQLASNETILWEEFLPYLRKLNVLLHNSLVLSLGTCFGISLISTIDPTMRAPFRIVIGAVKEISIEDIIAGFERYFDVYFFSFDPVKALQEMNNAVGGEKNKFFMITDHECFTKILDADRDPSNTEKIIMKTAIIEKISNPSYATLKFAHVKEIVKRKILELLHHTKLNSKDYFLMNDLVEEKSRR